MADELDVVQHGTIAPFFLFPSRFLVRRCVGIVTIGWLALEGCLGIEESDRTTEARMGIFMQLYYSFIHSFIHFFQKKNIL